jgi:hypothetical protein
METKKPIFSKKHYEKIAQVLNDNLLNSQQENFKQGILIDLRRDLIDLFIKDNSLFDEKRFIEATIKGIKD